MKFSGSWKLMPVLAAALLASACGKARFEKQSFEATAVAGQYVITKPKLDIIVFQDNSDSVMFGPIGTLMPQMHAFLNGINQDWDFHFTVLPLLNQQSITSKYVVANDCSGINGVQSCLSPGQSSTFNNQSYDYGWIKTVNSAVGNSDFGFYNIKAHLQNPNLTNSGFLRPDAALAIVVLSNGDDVDGVSYYYRDDGHMVYDYALNSAPFTTYQNFFANFKGASVLSKFYSVVSPGGTCYGHSSFNGVRYRTMSDRLGSRAYNLCSGELSSVLASLRQQFQVIAEAIRFNYVAMEHQPIVSSIVVKKNGVTIPQSSVNGWQYVGYLNNQPTSYHPTSGNVRSGYFIKLNGSAVYKGSDKITISFQRD
jgi:hypothetical protein